MTDLRSVLSRFLFPGLLIALGVLLLALSSGQSGFYLAAGAGVLAAGIISLLFVLGIISYRIQLFLFVILLITGLTYAYLDYKVIQDRIAYLDRKDEIGKKVIQRLKDIRTAQLAYLKANGAYAGDFETLIRFLKDGRVPIVKSIGSLPDSIASIEEAIELGLVLNKLPQGISEEEAIAQNLIIRDTIYVSALESAFGEEGSDKKRVGKFHVDSLPFVPVSNVRFQMKAGVVDVSGLQKPVFEVVDPQPFADQYKVGDLTQPSTNGNWTE